MEEDLVYVCLKQSSWNKGFNHDMLWQVNRRHMNGNILYICVTFLHVLFIVTWL